MIQLKTFRYKCISHDGIKTTGVLKAYDEFEAVADLRREYRLVTDIEEVRDEDGEIRSEKRLRIKTGELAMMCSQFSIILASGLPATSCLDMVAAQSKRRQTAKMLVRVAEDVGAGYSMAAAFEKNAPNLPKTFIETVRAGEESGSLETCFSRLHKYYDRSAKTRQKLISTMTYPAIVVLVAIVVFIIIMTVAVPMFIKTFSELGVELPAITRGMIAVSKAMTDGWWLILMLVAALACGYIYASRTERGKLLIGQYRLQRAPLRRLNSMNASAQFASTMSTLVASGITITKALDITAQVVSNFVFGLAVRKLKEGVEQGKSMAECMAEEPCFPKFLTEMTGVGERAGSMEESLDLAAEYFSNELDIGSQRLLPLLEPVITVVLAAVTVLLLLGVYLPMFSMYGAM